MQVGVSWLMVLLVSLAGEPGNYLLDYASSEIYWKSKGIVVSLDSMGTELKLAKTEDISQLIADLGSADPEVRRQSAAQILKLGPGVIPQLRSAADSPDPAIAASTRGLVGELSLAAKASSVRRLMAIRTLGEMKERDALPLLRPLLESTEAFIPEYAQRAIASIEQKAFSAPNAGLEERRAAALLLPAECRIVLQRSASGDSGISIEKVFATLDGFPGMDKQQVVQELTNQVVQIAEQIGDVRLDHLTLGVSGEVGAGAGFAVVVLSGQYDAGALRALLQKLEVHAQSTDGVTVFSPDSKAAVILPSDKRLIFLAAPEAQHLPMESMTQAARTGRGTLHTVPEMLRLIDRAEIDQPLWGALSVTDSYRELQTLRPFDSITLVGRRDDRTMRIQLAGEGSNAGRIRAEVADLNANLQRGVAVMKQTAQHVPFAAPYVEFLESINCTADGKTATLTAAAKVDSLMSALPAMLLGVRAQGEIEVQEVPPPVDEAPVGNGIR